MTGQLIHDMTAKDIVFLTIDGENTPGGQNGRSVSLRHDVGTVRGNLGLLAFSTSCRLMSEIEDYELDSRQTERWIRSPDADFFSLYSRPKPPKGKWSDSQSLGISSVIASLGDVTERTLPCLRVELVQTNYRFNLPLLRERPDKSTSVYLGFQNVMIRCRSLLSEIKAYSEALRRPKVMPRKVQEIVGSLTWIKEWVESKPELPDEIQGFLRSAMIGKAQLKAVYRTILPLQEEMGRPAFAELRAHLNRLTALSALIPFAEASSDKMFANVRCNELCQEFEKRVRLQFESLTVPGDHMDPLSIITLISTGLKTIDQFRELAMKVKGQNPSPPSSRAEQVGTALEVQHNGQVDQRIDANQIHMDQWDSARYDALKRRIRTQWDIYNDLFSNEAGASISEGARVCADMRRIQSELCKDFKEMVKLYERALGTGLPDHYQLYEVCQD